jgi:hypothetical protein
VQALAALAGKQFNEPLGKMMENYVNQPNLIPHVTDMTKGIVSDATGRAGKSGQAGDGYFSSDDASWFRNVMKSVLGLSGDAYLKATHAYDRYQISHDVANAFGGVLSDAGQSFRDQAPFGNFVWGNNVKQAARNPMAEVNQAAYDKLRALPPATAVQNIGLSRPGGVRLTGQDAAVNSDPKIVQLVAIANNYRQRIDASVQPQIQDIRKQIKNVDDDAHFNPQDRRTIRNNLVAKANELESKKNLMIEQMHAAMEWAAGGKHVSIHTFDPRKGMEQFHD